MFQSAELFVPYFFFIFIVMTFQLQSGAGEGEMLTIPIMESKPKTQKLMSIGMVGQKNFFINPMNNYGTWTQALDYCHQFGLMLATVETAEESNLVKTYLKTISTFRYFWLHGTDFGNETQFYWMNMMRPLNFSDWVQGEPQSDTMSNCLYTSVKGWGSESCSNQEPRPLCQKISMSPPAA